MLGSIVRIFLSLLLLSTSAIASSAVVQHKHGDTSGGSASSLTVTITSTTAGNNLYFELNVGGSPFLTYCKSNTGLIFTVHNQGSNPSNQTYAGVLINIPSGLTSVVCTFTGTDNTSSALEVWEVSGQNHATPIYGVSTLTAVRSSNVDTGNGSWAYGSNGFIMAEVNGGTITSNPKSGNEFTCGGDIVESKFGFVSLCNPTPGLHTPQWSDSGANASNLQEQESSFADVGGLTVNGEFVAKNLTVNSQ